MSTHCLVFLFHRILDILTILTILCTIYLMGSFGHLFNILSLVRLVSKPICNTTSRDLLVTVILYLLPPPIVQNLLCLAHIRSVLYHLYSWPNHPFPHMV